MKPYLHAIIFILVSATAAEAQQKENILSSPKLVIGLQAGITRECSNYDSNLLYHLWTPMKHATYPSVGIFARYYFGNHFAVQAGADMNILNKNECGYYQKINSVLMEGYMTVKTTAIDFPVLLQYHLDAPGHKIRPFFGIGLTTRYLRAQISGDLTGVYDRSISTPYAGTSTHFEYYPTVMQGITWQMNKKWQFNESVSGMFNGNSSAVALKLGLAFTLR